VLRGWWLAFALWLWGCSGSVERDSAPVETPGGVSASGGSADMAGVPAAIDGGAGARAVGSGGSSAELGGAGDSFVGAAGESPVVNARAESGTRLCQDDGDCNGLACSSANGRKNAACLASCESDLDCRRTERCFELPSFASTADSGATTKYCFQSCQDTPVGCAFQFDCADYYRVDQYLCLPTEWVRSWPPYVP